MEEFAHPRRHLLAVDQVSRDSVPPWAERTDNWNSDRTYIRHEDISEVERLLLEDQDWTEIELHGFHISRSWIEAIAAA